MLLRPRKPTTQSCCCDYCSESNSSSYCTPNENNSTPREDRNSVIVKVEAMEKEECDGERTTTSTRCQKPNHWSTDEQLSPSAMRSAGTQTACDENSKKTTPLHSAQSHTSSHSPSPLATPSPPIQFIKIKQERVDEDEERISTTPSPGSDVYNHSDKYSPSDPNVQLSENWRSIKDTGKGVRMVYLPRDSNSVSPIGYPMERIPQAHHYNPSQSPTGSYGQDLRGHQTGNYSPGSRSSPSPQQYDVTAWRRNPSSYNGETTVHEKESVPNSMLSPRGNRVPNSTYSSAANNSQKRANAVNNPVNMDYYSYPNDEEECLWQKFLRYRHKPHRKATYGKRSLNEEESLFVQYKRIRNCKEDDASYDNSRGAKEKRAEAIEARAETNEVRPLSTSTNNGHVINVPLQQQLNSTRSHDINSNPKQPIKHSDSNDESSDIVNNVSVNGETDGKEIIPIITGNSLTQASESSTLDTESVASSKDYSTQDVINNQRGVHAGRVDALVDAIKESKGMNNTEGDEMSLSSSTDVEKPKKTKCKVKRKQSESLIRRREMEPRVEDGGETWELNHTEQERCYSRDSHVEEEAVARDEKVDSYNEKSIDNGTEASLQGQEQSTNQNTLSEYNVPHDASAHAQTSAEAMSREMYYRHAGSDGYDTRGIGDRHALQRGAVSAYSDAPTNIQYSGMNHSRDSLETNPRDYEMRETADNDEISEEVMRMMESKQCKDSDVACYVNGLLSLPGMKETRYPVSYGELRRRANSPENLSRVEMISYVRQSKTSGRLLLDKSNVTSSGKRSKPTVLSRMCESEARVLADGIHRLNMEYFPVMSVGQRAAMSVKESLQKQGGFWEEALKKKIHTIGNARSTLRELQDILMECKDDRDMRKYELASHNFGVRNAMNNFHLFDRALAEFSFNLQNSFEME